MVPLSQVVAWVIWKPRVVHPLDSRMVLEKLRHPHCILTVPLHTDVQSLQSLQQEEAIERAQCRPQISKQLYPSLHSKSYVPVSYTHLRAHETDSYLVCRLLLEKKKKKTKQKKQ